ncbi:MAG: hypothetical protein KKA79_09710 [Nanoarchaeota archaeon]|nr:hypothetical protein [Nanoarchaeota archaeon]MCG2718617.1 hypothetical protein [Nanoarchaeota archaeon]
MNVTLIGTMHNDLKGRERLEKLLNHLTPDVLTLEGSDEMEEANKDVKSELAQVLVEKGITEINDIETFIEVTGISGYEWDVCKAYSKDNNMPLYKVECPGAEEFVKDSAADALYQMRAMSAEEVQQRLIKFKNFKKSRFRRHFVDMVAYNEFLLKGRNKLMDKYLIGERDEHMYEEIKEIAENKHPGKHIVHVGGAQHTVQKPSLDRFTLGSQFPDADVYLLSYADLL